MLDSLVPGIESVGDVDGELHARPEVGDELLDMIGGGDVGELHI